MNPPTQLCILLMAITNSLSLLLLLLMWLIGPGFFGFGWSFLVLLQLISTYCAYKCIKWHQPNLKNILSYLKSTNL